jgi:hypothetical protein
MWRVVVASAALLCVGAAREESLMWMSGGWCTAMEAGEQTCEAWSEPVEEHMAGLSRTVKNGAVVSEERMAIGEIKGKLTYIAKPRDAAEPTYFPLLSRGPTELVFENRAHDYPQRIRYWREGEVLMAEISLADGSKPMRWRYERVKQ